MLQVDFADERCAGAALHHMAQMLLTQPTLHCIVLAVDGEPRIRPTLVLAVSGDHRVLDGHTLAAFVSRVVELLEQPLLFEELR